MNQDMEIKAILEKVSDELAKVKEKIDQRSSTDNDESISNQITPAALPTRAHTTLPNRPIGTRLSRMDNSSVGCSSFGLSENASASEHVDKHLRGMFPQLSGKAQRNKCTIKNIFVKETFTREFCCLPYTYSNTTPSCAMYVKLEVAGLGKKKIVFEGTDKHDAVCQKIEQAYPRLKNSGLFTLHKASSGGSNRPLKEISIPYYDVNNIRKAVKGRCVIYVRPLQSNLQLHPKEGNEEIYSDNVRNREGAGTTCLVCGTYVSISKFVEHKSECRDGNKRSISEIESDEELDAILERNYLNQKSPNNTLSEQPESNAIDLTVNSSENIAQPPMNSPSVHENSSSNLVSSERTQESTVAVTPAQDEDIKSDSNIASSMNGFTNDTDMEKLNGRNYSSQLEKEVLEGVSNLEDQNPVEVLRKLQQIVLQGRMLESTDPTQVLDEGEVNFIMVDRANILKTALEELEQVTNLRLTLEVQFYGEAAQDFGGPRKEFFRLALLEIQKNYFADGWRIDNPEIYEKFGVLMSLSILQNGKIPRFIKIEDLEVIFGDQEPENICLKFLQKGFKELGIYQVCKEVKVFRHLMHPNSNDCITIKKIMTLLAADFSEQGSNARKFECQIYSSFIKYMHEAAAGRRGNVSLHNILQFVTGTDEEPVLGFGCHPKIVFVEVIDSFIPKANTCVNQMLLPRPSVTVSLPPIETLFAHYDYAFCNAYFGSI